MDGTADVRHKWYPFIPGVMERSYTDEELKNIDPPPFTFEGKEYDAYEATQMQLANGRSLMEVLKQPGATPMSMPHQVITLVAAGDGIFAKVKPDEVKSFQKDMLDAMDMGHREIIEEIESSKVLSDELKQKIIKTIREYQKSWHS